VSSLRLLSPSPLDGVEIEFLRRGHFQLLPTKSISTFARGAKTRPNSGPRKLLSKRYLLPQEYSLSSSLNDGFSAQIRSPFFILASQRKREFAAPKKHTGKILFPLSSFLCTRPNERQPLISPFSSFMRNHSRDRRHLGKSTAELPASVCTRFIHTFLFLLWQL